MHKESNEPKIKESLKRTQDKNYLELLKAAGYKIYPIKDCTNNKEIEEKVAFEESIENQENNSDVNSSN